MAKNYGVVKKSYFNSEYIFLAAILFQKLEGYRKLAFHFLSFHTVNNLGYGIIFGKILNTLKHSHYAFITSDSLKVDLTLADWKTLKAWSAQIDNWAQFDGLHLCMPTYTKSFPDKIYPTLPEME
ncbi:MAG: hypothetical protein R3A13_03480 [Bdellovibrionota bacterium]